MKLKLLDDIAKCIHSKIDNVTEKVNKKSHEKCLKKFKLFFAILLFI